MVALPPQAPPPYYDTSPTSPVASNIDYNTTDTTSDGNAFYLQVVDEDFDSSAEYTVHVYWDPIDWFHCWWDGEDTEWWPHDPRACARTLLVAKARLRYPVGDI